MKMAWQMYETQAACPRPAPPRSKRPWKTPRFRTCWRLLADMFSDEVFVYGDADMVDSLGLMQEVGGAMRYGPGAGRSSAAERRTSARTTSRR